MIPKAQNIENGAEKQSGRGRSRRKKREEKEEGMKKKLFELFLKNPKRFTMTQSYFFQQDDATRTVHCGTFTRCRRYAY